jgi:cell division protein FtsW (lipid II flippase)
VFFGTVTFIGFLVTVLKKEIDYLLTLYLLFCFLFRLLERQIIKCSEEKNRKEKNSSINHNAQMLWISLLLHICNKKIQVFFFIITTFSYLLLIMIIFFFITHSSSTVHTWYVITTHQWHINFFLKNKITQYYN